VLEQALEEGARVVAALGLSEQAGVAELGLARPAGRGIVAGGLAIRLERAGAIAGGFARPSERQPGPRRLGIIRRRSDELFERRLGVGGATCRELRLG